MRIGLWHNLPSGGGKRALFDQVRGLLSRGHSLQAWCPPSADRDFLPIGDLIKETVVPLEAMEDQSAFRFAPQVLRQSLVTARHIEAMESHGRLVGRLMNDANLDVLLASPCRRFYAPVVARFVQVPSILYLQEPCRSLYEARPTLPWIAEDSPYSRWDPRQVRKKIASDLRLRPIRVQAREERLNASAFSRILVNSYFSRENVLRSYGLDATVCYLGVDTHHFRLPTSSHRSGLLSVGEFAFHKNPAFLIRAVALSRSKPELTWAANRVHEDCYREMMTMSRSLGVSLRLEAGVTEERLIQLYQESLVMLYAPRLEPFGFAPLEANSCGLAVVATAEGGVRETIVDGVNGRLVDTPEAMATAIDTFVSDPAEAETVGRRASQLVQEKWTLEAASERLEAQLRQVIDESLRSRSPS